MNLNRIKPGTLFERDKAFNDNFSEINARVEDTARSTEAALEASFDAQKKAANTVIDLESHTADKNNPHGVTAIQLGLTNAYVYRGTVESYSVLPETASPGDVYNVANADESQGIKAGDNVVWDGGQWDNLSGVFDTSAIEASIAENTTTLATHSTAISELKASVENLEAGGSDVDLSNLIPKSGNRGVLNGYQQAGELYVDELGSVISHENIPDEAFEVQDGVLSVVACRLPDVCRIAIDDPQMSLRLTPATSITEAPQGAWLKVVEVCCASLVVELKDFQTYQWYWADGETPEINAGDFLVLYWTGGLGVVKKISIAQAG